MKNVPRVQMPGKANNRAYVEATHYDWLVHEMEGLRRKLDEALQERDAMGADRDRLAAELSAARADAERYRWLRSRMFSSAVPYAVGTALDQEIDAARAAPSAGDRPDADV